jgi:hypothetical protein
MASKKVRTNDETIPLIALYEASPELWDSRHMLYKDREKRTTCWQSMGEKLNASASDVKEKFITSKSSILLHVLYE